MKITLTQTQTVTKTIQLEYSNGNYLRALGELIAQEDQVEQNRAMNKTRDQKLIEHNIQWETLKDEADEYDIRADKVHEKKRKNKFISDQCAEYKTPRKLKKKKVVVVSDSSDDELTFENEDEVTLE